MLGTRDYVRKNGVKDVVIGLSGGIDSALTAAIAVDALGAEHVTGVSMPSRYSSEGSKSDAQQLAANLGIRYLTLPIEDAFNAMLATLRQSLSDATPRGRGLAEENVQARIRGNLLMALTNASGSIVLTTGNKSEMAVGYATLYGDMAGGFAVLKDVFKTRRLRSRPLAQRQSRRLQRAPADPREHHHQAAVGGTAPGSARYRLAATLRRAGSDPAGVCGGRLVV